MNRQQTANDALSFVLVLYRHCDTLRGLGDN